MKRSAEGNFLSGWKRGWKIDFYNINILRMIFHGGRAPVHFKIKLIDISFFFFGGKIKTGAAIFQLLISKSCFIVLVSIGPAMEPDKL